MEGFEGVELVFGGGACVRWGCGGGHGVGLLFEGWGDLGKAVAIAEGGEGGDVAGVLEVVGADRAGGEFGVVVNVVDYDAAWVGHQVWGGDIAVSVASACLAV